MLALDLLDWTIYRSTKIAIGHKFWYKSELQIQKLLLEIATELTELLSRISRPRSSRCLQLFYLNFHKKMHMWL